MMGKILIDVFERFSDCRGGHLLNGGAGNGTAGVNGAVVIPASNGTTNNGFPPGAANGNWRLARSDH